MTEEELAERLQNESGIYHQVSEADFDRFISLAGDARLRATAHPLGQQIIDIITRKPRCISRARNRSRRRSRLYRAASESMFPSGAKIYNSEKEKYSL